MAIIPSDDYAGQIDTGDGAYPRGKAKNVTVAGDGTGTPLEKAWVNDIWGFFQALLSKANVTPSGDPDEVGASQYLDAILSKYGSSQYNATGSIEFDGVANDMARIQEDDAGSGVRKLIWEWLVPTGRYQRLYLAGDSLDLAIGTTWDEGSGDWLLDGGAFSAGRVSIRMEGTGSSPTITAYSELVAGSWTEHMVLRLHPADDPGASSGFVQSSTIFPSLIPRLRAQINAAAGDTTPTISSDTVGISDCTSTANSTGEITCTFHANAQMPYTTYTVMTQCNIDSAGAVPCNIVVEDRLTTGFVLKFYAMTGGVLNLGSNEVDFDVMINGRMY